MEAEDKTVTERKACISFGYSWCDKNGHIPGGPIWMMSWLPKGYAPTKDDCLLAVFFDTSRRWDDFGLGGERPLPPLLQVIEDAATAYLREHPEEVAGHLVNRK